MHKYHNVYEMNPGVGAVVPNLVGWDTRLGLVDSSVKNNANCK